MITAEVNGETRTFAQLALRDGVGNTTLYLVRADPEDRRPWLYRHLEPNIRPDGYGRRRLTQSSSSPTGRR